MRLNKGVCYRKYFINGVSKTIIYNTCNEFIVFLEDLSAELFVLLLENNTSAAEEFIKKHDISNEELDSFIMQFAALHIIESDYELSDNNNQCTSKDNEKAVSDFVDELYKNGYMYGFHLDLTNRCNEKCIHCYHPFESYDCSKELTTEQIKGLIDDAYNLGVFDITLSGGEIFLRKDVFHILEYITSKNMIATLYTNASLINADVISKLKDYNIHKISVSIYADVADIHDSITQVKGSFDKTIAAIRLLIDSGFVVELKTVVLAENCMRIKEMKELAKSLGVGFILDFGLCGKINGDCSTYKHRVSNEIIRNIFWSEPDDYCGKYDDYKNIREDISPCGAGKYSLYCSAEGEIYPCVSFRIFLCNYNELSNIRENPVLKEWNDTKIKDFSDCFKHDYCRFCLEQCAGNNLIENGNYLNSNTSHCDRAKIISEYWRCNYEKA